MCLFFFFKQKTAYEMRISDWSSDVCSSDLKVVDGAPTFMSAPMVLPRSTAVTEAELAGAGAGSGIGAGTGPVVAGGVVIAASSWSFLQPARASVPSRAAAIAILSVLRVMECLRDGQGSAWRAGRSACGGDFTPGGGGERWRWSRWAG